MLTSIVIYILSCFITSLFISIFLSFKFGGKDNYNFLEEYILLVCFGFIFSAFILPLILFLLGVSIAIILGFIYLLNNYFGSVLFSFT